MSLAIMTTTLSRTGESTAQDRRSSCRQKGVALVFVRRRSNRFIGHVAWGYLVRVEEASGLSPSAVPASRVWNIGAVENPSGWLFARPGSDGFWKQQTVDPLSVMINHRYDQYKRILVEFPDSISAAQAEERVRTRDYSFTLINCMNDAYDVLTAYGVKDLPSPQSIVNWFPNTWFDHIHAPGYSIEDVCGLSEF